MNPNPSVNQFQGLLDKTLNQLEQDSKKNQSEYLTLLGNKLEKRVADLMEEKAIGTVFEGSIELKSGQKFPDIIAKGYYGVEVKTTNQNHWTTTGNSVMEGTRVDGIERIFMLFGKMLIPIEFKCRPYEDCLSEVVVTHSPRYLINMDLQPGTTIFDKLKIPYDNLRSSDNPIKPIIEYYRQFLKPGDQVWWMDQEGQSSNNLIIRLWNNLPLNTRNELMCESMIIFPEIFGSRSDKFNRVAVWLVNTKGIVCPNIRDVYTAGGQGTLIWRKRSFSKTPRIIIKMLESIDGIRSILENYDPTTLRMFWGQNIKNKRLEWIRLVTNYAETLYLPFNINKILLEKL